MRLSRPALRETSARYIRGGGFGWRLCALAAAACLAGCSRSPSQDIFGSYFPSWLLCLVAGVAAAILLRALLFVVGVGEHVFMPLLAYPAAALAVTFVIWLSWFGN